MENVWVTAFYKHVIDSTLTLKNEELNVKYYESFMNIKLRSIIKWDIHV